MHGLHYGKRLSEGCVLQQTQHLATWMLEPKSVTVFGVVPPFSVVKKPTDPPAHLHDSTAWVLTRLPILCACFAISSAHLHLW